MAAVRRGNCGSPGEFTDHSKIRPPTDVMAITSLPKTNYVVTRSRPYPCVSSIQPSVQSSTQTSTQSSINYLALSLPLGGRQAAVRLRE